MEAAQEWAFLIWDILLQGPVINRVRLLYVLNVTNMRVGRCLGPEGNGVSSDEGCEAGPGPPSREEDQQSTPSKEGGNMEQEEEVWA
jgi:hypothetical protein